MAVNFSKYSARATLRIDLAALKQNYAHLKNICGRATIGACVKADAYGLGIKPVARALYGAGCRVFFVATPGEGKILREHVGDSPSIYVFNGPASKDLRLFFGADLKPVINTLEQARLWLEAAAPVGSPPFAAIHIDTGINRLGFDMDEFAKLSKNKTLYNGLGVDLVMSHLACAGTPDHPMNVEQLTRFKRCAAQLPPNNLSFAASAGIYLGKPYHFQMVRPGISLFGGPATDTPQKEGTVPIITLDAPILQIRQIKAGEGLGYEHTYVAKKDMTVATIAAGYADGIPRTSSSDQQTPRSFGTLHGQRVPILGSVCMDLTTLDISNVKDPVTAGDIISFRGEHLLQDVSDIGTIPHDLLVQLGQRCRREYVT